MVSPFKKCISYVVPMSLVFACTFSVETCLGHKKCKSSIKNSSILSRKKVSNFKKQKRRLGKDKIPYSSKKDIGKTETVANKKDKLSKSCKPPRSCCMLEKISKDSICSGSTFSREVDPNFLVIRKQGSFMAGGSFEKKAGLYNPEDWQNQRGQTRHGDHAYIAYQIPSKTREYPVLFIHGAGQSGKCWESTPDGREGFQNLFLRQRYAVFIMDQPRMGRAGMGLQDGVIKVANLDQFLFDINRLGVWPKFYNRVQFPQDTESLEQFFRQMTPNTCGYNNQVIVAAIEKTLETISGVMKGVTSSKNPGVILITHSQSCCPGWYAAMKSDKVKAIIAIEPASGLPFPEKEWPGIVRSSSGILSTNKIGKEEFLKLTKIPIIIYFGDNIPNYDNHVLGQDNWYQRLKMAKRWVGLLNKNGGKAQVLHLPKIGIHGNTHFMFMDKNNGEVAKTMFKWLKKKGM